MYFAPFIFASILTSLKVPAAGKTPPRHDTATTMLHRRHSARFPPDVKLSIQSWSNVLRMTQILIFKVCCLNLYDCNLHILQNVMKSDQMNWNYLQSPFCQSNELNPPKTFPDHQELQGERFNCCEEGFRVPKKVQQAPGPSPKVDSAAGSGHHQYRAYSGMAAGRCEDTCTHNEAKTFGGGPGGKKGSKEATSLQEKHQVQTDILQKVQGLDC